MLEISTASLIPSTNSILERQPLLTKNLGVDSHTYRRRAGKRCYENRLYQKAAESQIGRLPDDGETIHMVVSAAYRTVDLIPAMLALHAPEPIAELYVATLSFNRQCLDLILELIDQGRIESFAFVVSTFSKNLEPAAFEYARSQLHARGQRIVAMFNHCKVIAARFAGGACYTSEGSANIRSHSTTENVALTHDAGLFEFHKGWMEEGLKLPDNEQLPARRRHRKGGKKR
jgi:hypothetical protein